MQTEKKVKKLNRKNKLNTKIFGNKGPRARARGWREPSEGTAGQLVSTWEDALLTSQVAALRLVAGLEGRVRRNSD